MLSSLLKRKLSNEQVANIFVNGIMDAVNNGFGEVVQLINEDVVFVQSPQIQPEQDGEFTLIVLIGNLVLLENILEPQVATHVEKLVLSKMANLYAMPEHEFIPVVNEYRVFINRVKHPSKRLLFGLAKAVFYKYNLTSFQDEYFTRMQAPNPLFLKRLELIIDNFLWDWDVVMKKYKI
jgi:hypothetical protein